jgi:hypothetical protein
MNQELLLKLPAYFFGYNRLSEFIVFNMQELSFEPVDLSDIASVKIDGMEKLRSAAWSSDAKFLFIIQKEGIYLLNPYDNTGFFCRKKSYKFFELFLESIENMSKKGGSRE